MPLLALANLLHQQFFVYPSPPPPTLSLAGQTALVTGSNTGLGFATADLLLTHHLTHLILAVRSPQKGQQARNTLLLSHPNAKISVWELDLLSPASVTALASRASAELPHLNIAILNAGIHSRDHKLAAETGNEVNIQVNYISTMQLAAELLPVLRRASGQAHLSLINSCASWFSTFPARDAENILARAGSVGPREIYNTSKLMGLFGVREMARRVSPDEVLVNCSNPGFCRSELHRDWKGVAALSIGMFGRLAARSEAVGARVSVYGAVVAGEESHGRFIDGNKVVR